MENKKVTVEEVIERINKNREVIKTAYGKVSVSKKFFAVCGVIGTVAAGIGVAGIATLGFVLVPVATTGLGVAAAVTGGIFYNGENNEERRLESAWRDNKEAAKRIAEKVKTK